MAGGCDHCSNLQREPKKKRKKKRENPDFDLSLTPRHWLLLLLPGEPNVSKWETELLRDDGQLLLPSHFLQYFPLGGLLPDPLSPPLPLRFSQLKHTVVSLEPRSRAEFFIHQIWLFIYFFSLTVKVSKRPEECVQPEMLIRIRNAGGGKHFV